MLALARFRRIDIVGIWDSNGTFGGDGWDHGIAQAMIDNGCRMYATPLYALGEGSATDGSTAAQGNGHGYGSGSDTDRIQHKSNSTLTTAMNTATCLRMQATLPHADLLKYWNMRNAGNYAPLDYVYAPTGTAWNASQSVGFMLYGGAANPIDTTAELRADVWLGEFPSGTNGWVQYRWIDNGAGVGSTGGTNSAGTGAGYAMRKVSHTLTAGARAGAVEFRIPMASDGQWFGTFCRAVNVGRSDGFSISALYSCGSQSTHDMAFAMLGMPDESLAHFFDAVTDSQVGTKKALVWVAIGPNDTSETNKLVGAPAGLGSDPAVVKYNVEQIVSRLTSIWTGMGRAARDLVILLTTHPPRESGNTTMGPYQAKLVEVAQANPVNVCALDMSSVVTYTELASNVADPTFASNGTDVNHLKNQASYELVSIAARDAVLGVANGGIASGAASLGMNIGTGSNVNDDPSCIWLNVFKLADEMRPRDWGGTFYTPAVGQKDADGWFKYIDTGAGQTHIYTIVSRRQLTNTMREIDIAAGGQGDIVVTWTGTGTLSLQGGSAIDSAAGRIVYRPNANANLELFITSLPASPGGSTHIKNIDVRPLCYEGLTGYTSPLARQRLAPFSVVRFMQSARVNTVGGKDIASHTVANPTVITCVGHGLSTSNQIVIPVNNGSTPTIAGTHTITKITDDTFSIPVNVTTAGKGGTWFTTTQEQPWSAAWSARATINEATWSSQRGIPLEAQVAAAEELGKIGWFCFHHNADDPAVNPADTYTASAVGVIQSGTAANKKFYVELGNELWNPLFQGQHDFKDRGRLIWTSDTDTDAAAKYRAQRTTQFALSVRGADANTHDIKIVAGGFILSPSNNGPELIFQTHTTGGLTVEDVCDVVAVAPYIEGDYGVSNGYGGTIKTEITNNGQASAITMAFAHTLATAIPDVAAQMADVAADWSLPVALYEGGRHLVLGTSPTNYTVDGPMIAFMDAFVKDARAADVIKAWWAAIKPYVEGPACYFELAGQGNGLNPTVNNFGSMSLISSSLTANSSITYRTLAALASPSGGGSGVGMKKITGKFTASKIVAKKVSGF